MNITAITDFFDKIAPQNLSTEWDNDGIMLSCNGDNIEKILITLDVNTEAVDKAVECGANLIISHHPFIFRPIKRIGNDPVSANIKKLIKNDISVLSYHTRMDSSDVGINSYILKNLGLSGITPFGSENEESIGRIGEYDTPIKIQELHKRIKEFFGCKYFCSTASASDIKKVAVVSGGGSEFASVAEKLGADVFISGEFRHHQFIGHTESNFSIISIDHYHCENVFVDLVYQLLNEEFPQLNLVKNHGTQPFSDIII